MAKNEIDEEITDYDYLDREEAEYPLHFFPQIPHRHESRLAGRTRMMIAGLVSAFSISTFSTTIRLTPAMNFAKLEIVTGLFS